MLSNAPRSSGLTCCRVDTSVVSQARPGHRPACPLPRQGSQGPDHTGDRRSRCRPPHLGKRTPRRNHRPVVPDPDRSPDEPRRGIGTAEPPHRRRSQPMPVAVEQAGHPARPPTHRRDASARGRSRRHDHRLVARARQQRDDTDLPACRPGAQGARDRTHHTHRHPAPVATSPATDSWPSSKPSDYAESLAAIGVERTASCAGRRGLHR